ncbi:topoisomerase DNA-binding C4 zinc finger domain-containing protein, partial [Patescibacteria group bacterium]|nr:topoisomerase DNA-binding C4 zinc finger domain-containing protein [Patescibacteria group bacterium]
NKEAKDVEFILSEIDGKKIEKQESFDLYDGKYIITKTTIGTKQEAEKVVADLNKTNISVSDVSKKESKRSPIPPSTTSTLQQEASRRFGYSGKRTMSLAQKLYEEGFITYHRTDSVAISQSAIFAFRGFIEKEYGKNYLPEFARFYKTKQKLAQEAHEAIRPTKVNSAPSAIAGQMGADYAKLYDIIWRRAVSSQMADARIESTLVIAETDTKKYLLKANGSALVFDGFLKINPQALKDNILPEFKAGEKLDPKKIEDKSHSTTSPPRYNDASIIATLEEKGIGRPSTYASIIDTITTRGYVEREEGRFKPTSVGLAVNDFLVKNFSTIDDLPFTAEMEDMLDKVAQGEAEWQPVIKAFYTPFNASLEKAEDTERVKIEAEEIDELCPLCSSKLVIRTGRFGKFISCSTFPNCKFTKPLIEETNFICSKDGGKVIIKKTRKGKKFYGCGNYPKCDFAVWKLEDIKKEQSSRKA